MSSRSERPETTTGRPAVSVVVPFAGAHEAAEAMLENLGRLAVRDGDEVIVADNSVAGVVGGMSLPAAVSCVPATRERSSYHARNTGAEEASNEWLLFIDADCRPDPALLDRYFATPVAEGSGLVAGGIVPGTDLEDWIARWGRSRRHLSEEHHVPGDPAWPHPAGITPNVLVRREVWESLGGFHEGVRSGADVEFSWRAQDAGWALEHRPAARVEHRYDPTLRGLARQAARHNAGRLWVRRRYPGVFERPRLLRPLARCVAGVVVWTATGRFERAAFKLIDAVSISGGVAGWYCGTNKAIANRARSEPAEGANTLVLVTDAFPARSETFVYNEALRLAERGWRVRVESSMRPAYTERAVARRLEISYLEDEPPRRKLADLVWLCARHPGGCLRDRRNRRRWQRQEEPWGLAAIAPAARRLARGGEPHLYAHFAAGAALHALRLADLLGRTYSISAHAYDIFQEPRNLPEKLERAAFAAGECTYTVEEMRALVEPPVRPRIHRIATGVDAKRFRRRRPYPGSGRVAAVGRHVEKKGFTHLVHAAALLRGNAGFSELVIAGEGPLRPQLTGLVAKLGLTDVVRLVGNVWGEHVAEFLEGADVVAIPAVLAADGDRDALPLISYEALAMEVPVVASDFVGLPEVVRPPWGWLVPPGDERALAEALAEVLALPAAERAERGRQGRAFVLEHGDPNREVAMLDKLLRSSGSAS